MSTVYGYCRISRKTQKIDRQIRNISDAYSGQQIHFVTEAYTGTTTDRPEWQKLYRAVKDGDTIVFDSVSRMSRNAEEGYKAYEELDKDNKLKLRVQGAWNVSNNENFVENVKQLKGHDKGNTLKVILEHLKNAGYKTYVQVLAAKDFGVPQNRERIYIVGCDCSKDGYFDKVLKLYVDEPETVAYIVEGFEFGPAIVGVKVNFSECVKKEDLVGKDVTLEGEVVGKVFVSAYDKGLDKIIYIKPIQNYIFLKKRL